MNAILTVGCVVGFVAACNACPALPWILGISAVAAGASANKK